MTPTQISNRSHLAICRDAEVRFFSKLGPHETEELGTRNIKWADALDKALSYPVSAKVRHDAFAESSIVLYVTEFLAVGIA